MAEKASPHHRSAMQAVLDQICHETQALLSLLLLSFCRENMVEGMKNRNGGEGAKNADSTWSQQQGGQRRTTGKELISRHRPSPGSGRRLSAVWLTRRPRICRPAAKPAPAACQGLAIWPGTDLTPERARSSQSRLPLATGCSG